MPSLLFQKNKEGFFLFSDTARCLRRIGDDLVNNVELNSLLDKVTITKDTAFETFASIAAQIFSDGVINWGRVVALFYFGYKMVVKVLFDGGLLKTIIKWILRFIGERLVQWIAQAGGWVSWMKLTLVSNRMSDEIFDNTKFVLQLFTMIVVSRIFLVGRLPTLNVVDSPIKTTVIISKRTV